MNHQLNSISVVIPTYRREEVLIDTIGYLMALSVPPIEILVVDQTEEHSLQVAAVLRDLEDPSGNSLSSKEGGGKSSKLSADTLRRLDKNRGVVSFRRIILSKPSIPHAMNEGLLAARGEIILFLDDDLIPGEDLIAAHLNAYEVYSEVCAVVGQVLQPEESFETCTFEQTYSKHNLRRDLSFKFNSMKAIAVENVMAGNLSVRRKEALRIGGFDENFLPPVSFRFETEFAKRLVAAGGQIIFEPKASIRHLRAGSGGTRSRGSHLTSISPIHGAGDYYYALLHGRGFTRFYYMAIRPFRQIRTKFHLTHPWFIPQKFIGELRAIILGVKLYSKGARLLDGTRRVTLVNTAQPDRPNGSMVRYGAMVREALELVGCSVSEINLSPTQAWLERFSSRLQAPLRYLCIAVNAKRMLPCQEDSILHLLDGSHAYLLAAVHGLKVPLVVSVHDIIPYLCLSGELKGSKPGQAAAWILKKAIAALSKADGISAVSENTRKDVCRVAEVESNRSLVVHSAVFAPVCSKEDSISNEPYILHVAGNNNFYKNRIGVVDIFCEMRKSVSVQLKLAGAPPDDALRQHIQNCGYEDDIEFCLNVSESQLAQLYKNAIFLLFPSFYEGFGWPPLEAMALGCPVLCSNAGSLAEVAGDAAWTTDAGDVLGFATYGALLCASPTERSKRSVAGLSHIQAFNLKAMGDGFLQVYRAAETIFSNKLGGRL